MSKHGSCDLGMAYYFNSCDTSHSSYTVIPQSITWPCNSKDFYLTFLKSLSLPCYTYSGTGRNPGGRKRQTGTILTPGKETTAMTTISTACSMKSTARRALTRATGRVAVVTHPRSLKTRRGADTDDERGMGLRSVPFQLPSIMELSVLFMN